MFYTSSNSGLQFAWASFAMKINWVQIGKGRMALGHRPKLRAIPFLPAEGCGCVVTLLSEKEGALEIGSVVRESAIRWIWIPLATGNPPQKTPNELHEIEEAIHAGFSVFIHCSAGMHRTGMIALAVLRRIGYTEAQSLELIKAMRIETFAALNQKHIGWANSTVKINSEP